MIGRGREEESEGEEGEPGAGGRREMWESMNRMIGPFDWSLELASRVRG